MSALARYGRAVQDRVKTNTQQSTAEYQGLTSDLDRTCAAFAAQAVSISGKSFSKLTAAVNAYKERSGDLVVMADNRRAVFVDYSTGVESLNARVKSSMDGAWTIFGRVVARQSLLQLSAELDAVRSSSAVLGWVESGNPPEMAPLSSNQQAAAKILEANENGFRRSQGDQWY